MRKIAFDFKAQRNRSLHLVGDKAEVRKGRRLFQTFVADGGWISSILQVNLRTALPPGRLLHFFAVARRNSGTLCVLIVYCVAYATLICRGHGIPYVMDNNETFSAFLHAYNLWHFDFLRSFGLTDEAASPFAAAHPFVHTHQGDFPRLFSFILYGAGARTVESQIWITTFTVGLASVLMAKSFYRRTAGDLFATIATLMLITDYLLFAQWQVNTYRVWHGFFLFGALLCVHGISEWRRPYWVFATILLYACMLYWELVFAAFVAVTAGAYTVWLYWRRPRLIALAAVTQIAGAAIGLGVLVLQLVFFLGWQDFLTDIKLTYLARNLVTDATIESAQQFYQSRHIVFWGNFQSAATFGLFSLLPSLFTFVFQVQTPLFVLMTFALTVPALIADIRLPGAADARALDASAVLIGKKFLTFPIVALLFTTGFTHNAVIGARPALGDAATALFSVAFAIVIAKPATNGLRHLSATISVNGAPPGVRRCAMAGCYLIAMGLLIGLQGVLYAQIDRSLFEWLTPVTGVAAQAAAAAIVLAGSLIILTGSSAILGPWRLVPRSLLPFLCCGLLGYLFSYRFNAGYLHSGYLYRLCPFFVFHADALLALGPFVVIATSANFVRRFPVFLKIGATPAAAAASLAAVGGAAAVLFAVYWADLQLKYVSILPPDRFIPVSLLENIATPNEGIVSNTYAAPFRVVAKTWAYTDPDIKKMLEQPTQEKSANAILWLADRGSNEAYHRPGIFICFQPLGFYSGLIDMTNRRLYRVPRCADTFASGEAQDFREAKLRLVARDEKGDFWAIYRIKWRTQYSPQGSNRKSVH